MSREINYLDEMIINEVPNLDGEIKTKHGIILSPEQNINYEYIKSELSDFDWINDMDKHLIIVNILSLSLSTKYTDNSFSRYENEKSHLDIIVRNIFRRESRKSGDDVLLKDKCYEIINSIKTKNFILAENISDNELYSIIKEKYTNSEMKEFILYIRNILKNKFEKLSIKDISYIVERINTIAHITSNESSSSHSDFFNLYQNAIEYMGFLLQRYDEYGSSLMTYFSCIIDAVINSNTTEEQRNKMRENIDCNPLIKDVTDDSKKEYNNQMNSYRLPEDDNDEKEYKFFPGEYKKPIGNDNRSEIRACQVNGGYYGIVTNTDMNDTFKNCDPENKKMSMYNVVKENFDNKTREEFYFYMTQELKSICPQIDKDGLLRIISNIDSYHDLDKHIYSELYEKTYNGIFQFIDIVSYKKRIDPAINKKIKIKCKIFIDVISDSMKNKNNIKIKGELNMDKVLQPKNRIETIDSFLNDFRDFLITKNKNYGDSALRPINVFNKLDSSNSITVRIDDKLSRIINSDELRENDCQDLFGYLILYCISEELYCNENITTPEGQKTEDKINVFINVFRREIKEKYIDILKDLVDTRQPFAKLTISKKIGMELDNLICKFKGSKKLVKDDIFFFMILLVSIILENGWTDMEKFID